MAGDTALIDLDLERSLGPVDRRIFGGFIEHLGRCIYGGVFDPGSPLSDARGFRRDVLSAARRLRIPVLRWPGGNFASGYRWTDGVGAPERRPPRLDLAWHATEPNTFGTDEFIDFCRELEAEPYICLNMGTGTLDEALAWVEYCNRPGATQWADLRRMNGHIEPHRVRYWGLGNEMWGEHQIGHLSADDYVRKARRWASALRRVDPKIELVACGNDGLSEWDRIVVDGLVGYVDYHSIHIYTGSHDYWENVLAPHRAERALRICGALIERARHLQNIDREVGIAYDEWNVWYRETDERRGFEERYTLADALVVATFLNVFVRQCRVLRMANLAQMVNVLAPMVTSPGGLLLQASYHPLRLFAEHVQDIALDPLVACETAVRGLAGMGPLGVLDVAATRDADCRRAAITIVNRSPDKSVAVAVRTGRRIRGEVRVHAVQADSIDAVNTFAEPDVVNVRTTALRPAGDGFELSMAPHSFACVELSIG